MPYICRSCSHYAGEVAPGAACPSCGGGLRFTMFDNAATATATLDPPKRPAWKDPYVNGYEEIEAPWAFRYAQIGIGISTYFFVWRWGSRALTLLVGNIDKLPQEKQATLGVIILILNCIGAFAGGAASGIWARSWAIQGLGVAAGVLVTTVIGAVITAPKSWPYFAGTLVATCVFALAGAFAGHTIVKPTRIPKS